MGVNTNAAKAAQLGMPFGTAAHRLRKLIMFRMMQKCGEDVCFKCGQPIEVVDDLSIEHKEPWFGSDTGLFWDLDNVAWSHLQCNRPDRPELNSAATRQRWDQFREKRTGTSWCWICKQQLPLDKFSKNKSKVTGAETSCVDCRKTYRKQRLGG